MTEAVHGARAGPLHTQLHDAQAYYIRNCMTRAGPLHTQLHDARALLMQSGMMKSPATARGPQKGACQLRKRLHII